MRAENSHTRQAQDGDLITCWSLPGFRLESRWREPARLLAVNLLPDAPATSSLPGESVEVTTDTLRLLAWLSCEHASRTLALDDSAQAELALTIMMLKEDCLDGIAWQDERPAGGDNVTPLAGRTQSMK